MNAQRPISAHNLHRSCLLDRAGRWMLESGIQDTSGGVARYYRYDTERNWPVSTEITAYALAALLYLHGRTGDAAYLDAATRAGRFLVQTAWNRALCSFPFELNGSESRSYFFDSGIILRALLALARETGDTEYSDVARACGRTMATDFDAGRDFHPVLLLPSKQPAPRDSRWCLSVGCYQLKAALAWLDLASATATNGTYRHHYERVLEYALRDHATFLPGTPKQECVMDRLHAYCYFLEGLLPLAGEALCREALADGIRRASGFLREIESVFLRSDVCAQLLRVRLYAAALGAAPLNEAEAAEEAAALPGFQIASADPRVDGAFAFGRRHGDLLPFANPVSTAFAVQALEMWKDWQAGRFDPDWRVLI